MTAAPATAAKILIVEDEEPLLFTLAHNLRREGYAVVTATRGDDGLKLAREQSPDLIILDLMLPAIDGIQICRLLRRDNDVPIIMLTALGGERDKVVGLDTGADDYVAKPFGMRELLARVRALLRRKAPQQAPSPGEAGVSAGDLEANPDRREISRSGAVLRLKPMEYDLLVFLMRNPGRVFSREHLLDAVWGREFSGTGRTVDVHIRWLRQKIEDDPANPRRIRTVRGSGYIFEG